VSHLRCIANGYCVDPLRILRVPEAGRTSISAIERTSMCSRRKAFLTQRGRSAALRCGCSRPGGRNGMHTRRGRNQGHGGFALALGNTGGSGPVSRLGCGQGLLQLGGIDRHLQDGSSEIQDQDGAFATMFDSCAQRLQRHAPDMVRPSISGKGPGRFSPVGSHHFVEQVRHDGR
jgi:hypothetical protein